jgi:hypothetical protein
MIPVVWVGRKSEVSINTGSSMVFMSLKVVKVYKYPPVKGRSVVCYLREEQRLLPYKRSLGIRRGGPAGPPTTHN